LTQILGAWLSLKIGPKKMIAILNKVSNIEDLNNANIWKIFC
jgi:hypothetical protein